MNEDRPDGLDHEILSGEDERRLARRAHAGDEAARDELARHNLRLVWGLAGSFAFGDRDELFGLGCQAMLSTIPKWNPDAPRATRLASYLKTVLYREMLRAVRTEERYETIAEGHPAPPPDGDEEDPRTAALAWIEQAFEVAGLNETEKQILSGYHGLRDGQEALSFRRIGEELNLAKSTVHDTYQHTLTKVRAAMGALAPAVDGGPEEGLRI